MTEEKTYSPRAIVYLRAARSNRDDSSGALAAQRHACERYAAKHGLVIAREYIDHASGAAFEERSGLQELLGDLKPGDHVIAYDHARIAQNMRVYTRIAWTIELAGAQLEIASEQTQNAADKFVSSIQLLMAGICSRQREAERSGRQESATPEAKTRGCDDGQE